MGYSIPEDMDGRVIKEAIREDYLQAYPIVFSKEKGEVKIIPAEVCTSEEAAEIEKQLRSLGYMG